MAQLQHMDARLDTLSTKLYQLDARVGRIAPEATPSPPPLVAFDSDTEDDDDDDGDDDDAFDDDDDGNASSTDEMSS